MSRVVKQWTVRPHDGEAVDYLARTAGVNSVVAQLLWHRGIRTSADAKRFLKPQLSDLHSPQLMPGVASAATRILLAIQQNEPIRIFGDYDADGVTGTAILVRLITLLGGQVDFYIPHRLDEGYGLNADAVRQAHSLGIKVMVTVDCGITAVEEAIVAKELGLDLIITDHHEPKAELPAAFALVHPRLAGDYPFGGLSGSGVAFKLAWVIAQQHCGSDRVSPELREALLDSVGIAALGLIADVVPLRDENRVLVKFGLDRIAKQPSLGLCALMDTAKLTDGLKSEDISFRMAPRLNAAGRLGCAMLVVELLTTRNPAQARKLAECLDGYNTQRQTIERRISAQVREAVLEAGYDQDPAIVMGGHDWHQGVIGIVAGRLVEQFGKPVILIASKENDAVSSGSGRSVAGLALHEALQACTTHLIGHGGHAAAAGVRLLPSNIDAFRVAFNNYVRSVFPDGVPAPRLVIDSELPLASITLGLLKSIDALEPYGAENPKPRFLLSGLTIDGTPRRMGTGERHLSFRIRQHGTAMRAVAFGMGDRLEELMAQGGACSLVVVPKLNEWQGQRSVEVEVIDFRAGTEVELC